MNKLSCNQKVKLICTGKATLNNGVKVKITVKTKIAHIAFTILLLWLLYYNNYNIGLLYEVIGMVLLQLCFMCFFINFEEVE